uniref:Secreted protein n=1 Tax=Panagrellus redivivus TaxID=6233 RepID=A0A7E4V0N3_PANRE
MLLRVALIFCAFTLFFTVCNTSQLWCQQGGGKHDWGPAECDNAKECYKYECFDGQSPFLTRGCGVPQSTATGLANESCFQAIGVCQYLGGTGHCDICSDKHMCNSTSTFTINWSIYLMLSISLLYILS